MRKLIVMHGVAPSYRSAQRFSDIVDLGSIYAAVIGTEFLEPLKGCLFPGRHQRDFSFKTDSPGMWDCV